MVDDDDDGEFRFEWEVQYAIDLEYIWMQCTYRALGIAQQPLLEFPIIAVDDPDVLYCVVRDEFHDKAWMIMIDTKYAYTRLCTPYISKRFGDVLPTVLFKDLN